MNYKCALCNGTGKIRWAINSRTCENCNGLGRIYMERTEAKPRKEVNLMGREIHVGDVVVFHDARGIARNSVVTAVWSEDCINVVFVSGDTNRTDQFGRQIERETSVQHSLIAGVHGMCWRFPDEPVPEYRPPAEV